MSATNRTKRKPKKDDACYETTAIKEFGLTKTLVRRIGHTKEVPNPHYTSGPPSRLYSRAKIRTWMKRHPKEIEKLQRRREKRSTKPKRDVGEFEGRYGTSERILKAACEALFSLNRYAKHKACTCEKRDKIYNLKNKLIHYLYKNSRCGRVYRHVLTLDAKVCFHCRGDGMDWDAEDGDCERCSGTGEYQPEKTLYFAVFHFAVGDARYCWHQPEETLYYPVEYSESEPSEMPLAEEKPIKLNGKSRKYYLRLLEWALSRLT